MAKIEAIKNGPLLVEGLKSFKNSKSEDIKNTDGMALCRCGQSSNKPFCDGTHYKAGFTDGKEDGRLPDEVKSYEGKDITIHDNRGVCSHAGHCTDNSPKVFRMKDQPWIAPDEDDADRTKKTIKMCPSGALAYDAGDEHYKDQNREPGINIEKDGPYRVVGGPDFRDVEANKPESKEHYSLCRCGQSKNKPFCDGAHWHAKFKDEKN
jgi:CDGSH-type Zn-finger protein/ferredoxin